MFFTVMKGDYDALLDWPFRQKVTFMILDQETGRNNLVESFRPDPKSSSFKRPTSEMNIACGKFSLNRLRRLVVTCSKFYFIDHFLFLLKGCPLFAKQCDVEGVNSRFIKDDTIFIKIIIDLQNIRHP